MDTDRLGPAVISNELSRVKALQLDQITAHVCRVLGVDFEELCGNGRRPQTVMARSMISYFARRLTWLSFPEIARGIGRPTHSTIVHAEQRLVAMLAREKEPCSEAIRVDIGGQVMTIGQLVDRMMAEMLSRGFALKRAGVGAAPMQSQAGPQHSTAPKTTVRPCPQSGQRADASPTRPGVVSSASGPRLECRARAG